VASTNAVLSNFEFIEQDEPISFDDRTAAL